MFCMFYTHTTNKKTMFHGEITHHFSKTMVHGELSSYTHHDVCVQQGRLRKCTANIFLRVIYTHNKKTMTIQSIHVHPGREYCRAGGCSAPQRNTRAAQRPADRSEFLKSRIPTRSTVSNNYGVATVSRID